MQFLNRIALAGLLALISNGALAETATSITALTFLGAKTIANDVRVDGTLVGGLSGLDYDAKTGLWYALSDDKSDINPARFYTMKLAIDQTGFKAIDFVKAVTLLQDDGQPYPNVKAGGEVPDPEAIRVDPESGNLWWTSEGDRRLGLSPFVRVADTAGKQVAALLAIPMFAMNKDKEAGPRHNNSYEGLSFALDGKSVWIGMESAIYEDGPIATVDAGSVARMTRIDRAGTVLSQFAYPIDAIPARPTGKNADNGVSEMLAIGESRFLVIERSGVEGADGIWKNYIRLYDVDASAATNVAAIASLKGADVKLATKKLLLNLNDVAEITQLDNIECISFGPELPNGHRTLVLASDNNFNATQINLFLAFEVIP